MFVIVAAAGDRDAVLARAAATPSLAVTVSDFTALRAELAAAAWGRMVAGVPSIGAALHLGGLGGSAAAAGLRHSSANSR